MATRETISSGSSDAKRACDECKSRKIKCDKEIPCSACRQSRRNCLSTGPGQKLGGIRQRVLISSQYEHKLNSFEERLGSIEGLLEQLTVTLDSQPKSTNASSYVSSTDPRGQTSAGGSADSDSHDPPGPVYEGDSSLSAHATFAHDFIGHVVQGTISPDVDPRMRSALSTLRQIIQKQNKKSMTNELRFPGHKGLPDSGIRALPLPPSDFALQCLKDMKETRPRTFDIRCPYLDPDSFADFCRRVYFPKEDYSAAAFVIVNGALFYLLDEKLVSGVSTTTMKSMAEVKKYKTMCEQNLFAAFSDINPFWLATKDNLKALLMGESFAIEASRPLLAWQMNCLAAQICQTLGYHRLPLFPAPNGGPSADKDNRTELIVFAYILDKGLALRLGRASAFQDYDLLVPSYTTIKEAEIDPWELASLFWFRHAQIQGKIYEQLYSSSARVLPPAQRVQFARNLAEEVKTMIRDAEHVGTFIGGVYIDDEDPGSTDWDAAGLKYAYLSEMVTYYGTLSLIYRAIPVSEGEAGPFVSECVEAGRTALQHHMECMQISKSYPEMQAGYVHWTVLFNPFFPLVMLFCQIVQEQDHDSADADLSRLADFTTSLEATCQFSEAIQQLHRLSQTLHTIASLYTSAKAPGTAQSSRVVGPDIHQYLNQLGSGLDETLMPSVTPMMGVEFGNWFNGNLDIMGLLEEDLSRFCP
ncbi:fungal-specific transcription factor domain-containing protein [Immersiella caudata]|uniref:Fungal-specific transcription factor domain-containing protein n=1 Tax=Immersiella caudata TaxID=314043 RepID=A0AA39WB16_9PEZI|nr:fungal-specific transcription factor domain-containing protein [Immersiella caudata]